MITKKSGFILNRSLNIVNVKAKDLGTNKEQSITITATNTLSDEEIDKMMKEAEKNKEADAKKKELADVKNDAEQIVFMTEKALKDLGDKVTESDKKEAEELMEEVTKAIETEDVEKITVAKDKLLEKANALATKVYEEAAKNNQTNTEDTTETKEAKKADDGVVDAEYEEK